MSDYGDLLAEMRAHLRAANARAETAEARLEAAAAENAELRREASGNFEALPERTDADNFHTSIYEADYKGLLIARCNQNGAHPHQVAAILRGLNGKKASADLLTAAAVKERSLRDVATKAAAALNSITAIIGAMPLSVGIELAGAHSIAFCAERDLRATLLDTAGER